jgi:hypothetical protein
LAPGLGLTPRTFAPELGLTPRRFALAGTHRYLACEGGLTGDAMVYLTGGAAYSINLEEPTLNRDEV